MLNGVKTTSALDVLKGKWCQYVIVFLLQQRGKEEKTPWSLNCSLVGLLSCLLGISQGQSGVSVFSSFLVTTSLADLYFLASNLSVGFGIVGLF